MEQPHKKIDEFSKKEFATLLKKISTLLKKKETNLVYTSKGLSIRLERNVLSNKNLLDRVKFVVSVVVPGRITMNDNEFIKTYLSNKENSATYLKMLDSFILESYLGAIYVEGAFSSDSIIEDVHHTILLKEQMSNMNLKKPYKVACIRLGLLDPLLVYPKQSVTFEVGKHSLSRLINELKEIEKKLD